MKSAAPFLFAGILFAGFALVGEHAALAQSGSLCNVYQANQTPPTGYGAAWHVFYTSRGLLLNSYCNANSTELRVGISDASTHYIYKRGYVYTGTWQPFTLSGNFVQGSTDWLQGQGSYTYPSASAGPVYWVGYLCHLDVEKSQWFCGCRDATCAQSYWMLQAFQRGSSGGGGVSGGTDTFSCLSDFNGPTKTISGNQGYTRYDTTNWASGTKFDARNATFRAKWNPTNEQAMNIILGGNWRDAPESKMCWAGGTITGENSTKETWCQNYSSNAFGISVNAVDSVVTGMRLHNMHDGIRFTSHSSTNNLNFTIKDNWITYNRDDCIENDAMHGGTIEDNLFDGCYVFYSAVNVNSSRDGSHNTVVVRDNVVRLEAMPGPRESGGGCDAGKEGHGVLWKIGDGDTPKLSIHNNVFLLEGGDLVTQGGWMQGDRDDRIASCSNNTVVWAGGGSPPKQLVDGINRHGNCFTLTTNRSVYDNAKQQWINRHD